MALGDVPLRFAWQAWYLWDRAGCGDALGHAVTSRDAAPLCEAGAALGDIHLRFTWQAWRLATSTVVFCVAGVVYLWGWAGSGEADALGPAVASRDAA